MKATPISPAKKPPAPIRPSVRSRFDLVLVINDVNHPLKMPIAIPATASMIRKISAMIGEAGSSMGTY